MLMWTPMVFFGKATLSGQTVLSFQSGPNDAVARVKVDNDGNVYQSEDTGTPSWLQIDTTTDWLRPTTLSPGTWEVRYTGLTGAALDSETAAEDTWHPLSSGDFILVQSRLNGAGAGSDSSTFTIELRPGGAGSAIASASYTLTAQTD